MTVNAKANQKSQKSVFSELELPHWLYLPQDYDDGVVVAQDVVSRMSAEEQREAMEQITEAFKKGRKIKF